MYLIILWIILIIHNISFFACLRSKRNNGTPKQVADTNRYLVIVPAALLLTYLCLIRLLLGWELRGTYTVFLFYLICFVCLDYGVFIKLKGYNGIFSLISRGYTAVRSLYIIGCWIALFAMFPYSIVAVPSFTPDVFIDKENNPTMNQSDSKEIIILDNIIMKTYPSRQIYSLYKVKAGIFKKFNATNPIGNILIDYGEPDEIDDSWFTKLNKDSVLLGYQGPDGQVDGLLFQKTDNNYVVDQYRNGINGTSKKLYSITIQ